jgi:hypothetical protein
MSVYQGKDADFDIFVLRPKDTFRGEELPEGYVQVNLDWRMKDPDEADERNDSKNVPAQQVAEVVNEHRPDETAVAEALREEIFPGNDRFRDETVEMDVITYETFREEYLGAVEEAIGSPRFDLEETVEEGGIPGLPARASDVDEPEDKIQEILDYLRREAGLEIFYRTGAAVVTSSDSSWRTTTVTEERKSLGYAIDRHWDEVQCLGHVVPASTLESL